MIFVDEPGEVTADDYSIISSKFRSPGNEIDRLWYKTNAPVHVTSDIFLISTLIPAMKLGENLSVAGTISEKLYKNIPKIQDILCSWYPELKKINVNAEHFTKGDGLLTGTACFFSGGVDSFYTLLKHKDEITKIIYVRGFDVGLYEREYLDMMSRAVRKMADALGKELIEVETNVHVFGDQYVDWSYQYHGSALASVASLLANKINKIYIPSSYTYKDVFPWGTHPMLDNLWSTERIEIIHDGCEASRIQKIQKIITNPCALDHLRVCIDRTSGFYNCSECEKCVRTMISLHAFGVLDKCKTFRGFDMNAEAISKLKLNEHTIIFQKENYNALPEGEIKAALKIAIDNFEK